ncbi:helix-turn-helix domain-containing protein [Phycobacter sp. K97]|uniref:helix-turn-helix domain-containing protein n=1 Tax=Phycobacter sedimenti TaxID=3133977 RepID=UPI00311EB692
MHEGTKPQSEYVNFKAFQWALSVEGLAQNTRSLFLELARRSDEYGCSHIGRRKIAEVIGCSRRTIDTHVSKLVSLGLIRRIGRYTATQGQITSVTQLSAWPNRARIPTSGHPKYGKFIKEDALDALIFARSNLQDLQGAGEDSSNHRKYSNRIEATTQCIENEALVACLDALGPWANETNRRNLSRRVSTLSDLLDAGYDLEKDVFPTLREMSKRGGKIPTLRSWKYFEDPIRHFAEARNSQGHKPGTECHSTSAECEEGYADPSDLELKTNREMSRFLRSVIAPKRMPLTGGGS